MNNSEEPNTKVIYREKQWVPWYWWILAAGVVALISAQMGLNRSPMWYIVTAIICTLIAVWVLLSLSKTTLRVELDADGSRWLIAGQANLPADVVSRSLAVPHSAKANAMGRQLDPAAFVLSHGWVKEMVMLVLDDPEDPTPYWLISTKNPRELLRAYVPEQAEQAITPLG